MSKYNLDTGTITSPVTGNVWAAATDHAVFQFTAPPTSIIVYGGPGTGAEMLRISPEGFWVRGQLVPQDQNEAAAVYNAVRQWATWHRLSQP